MILFIYQCTQHILWLYGVKLMFKDHRDNERKEERNEGNVLFNDALNTCFYMALMRGNPKRNQY